MVQTFHPDMIILYLSSAEFRGVALPAPLLRLTAHGLTIKYVTDEIRQYLKLVPALREHPRAVIVTYDDDVFYPSGSLDALVRSFRADPSSVHANRARLVPVATDGRLLNDAVFLWKIFWGGERPPGPSPLVFPEGVGGTLYPPGVLHADATNETLFTYFAPTHDDLWFWAMTVVNGKMPLLVEGYVPPMNISGKLKTKRLCDINIGKRADRIQNRRVFERYIGARLAEERQRRSQWY
jgi:hypothetical protein